MITKAKDLSKALINNQDVMIHSKLVRKASTLHLELVNEKDKASYEEWDSEIVAVGSEVTAFKPGDMILEMKMERLQSVSLDDKNPDADRISVVHMNNIEIAIPKEFYEFRKNKNAAE